MRRHRRSNSNSSGVGNSMRFDGLDMIEKLVEHQSLWQAVFYGPFGGRKQRWWTSTRRND